MEVMAAMAAMAAKAGRMARTALAVALAMRAARVAKASRAKSQFKVGRKRKPAPTHSQASEGQATLCSQQVCGRLALAGPTCS